MSWKITENEKFGRHLIATKEIPIGEVIIDELPLVSGPVIDTINIICVVCTQKPRNPHPCPHCGIQLCPQCLDSPIHTDSECRILQLQLPETSLKTFYNFVLTLRALYLRLKNPISWEKIKQLQSSVEKLRSTGAFSEINVLFSTLKWEHFKPEVTPTEDIVSLAEHCLGAMRMNSYSEITSKYSIEGLYFLSSFLTHSCTMNTDRQILFGGRMITRAAVLIKPGDVITTSYVSLLNGNFERWKEISNNWFFCCCCERCQNFSEFGSHLDSVVCSCGGFLSSRVIQGSIEWKCGQCGGNSEQAEGILKEIEDERPQLTSTEALENWLNCTKLHQNNSAFIQIKYYLCLYYGRDFGIQKLNTVELRRKYNHCEAVLGIWNKILPSGVYKQKGVILFELWTTLVEMQRRERDDASDERLESIARNCMEMLQFAEEESQEYAMYEILLDFVN